jgi:hypothetical protein
MSTEFAEFGDDEEQTAVIDHVPNNALGTAVLERLNRPCNCENSACTHHPGPCTQGAGDKRIVMLGGVCDDCAASYPTEYHAPSRVRT